jgi:signal peptidase I
VLRGVAITTQEAIGCQLVAEALQLSGTARIRVFGTSMFPAVLPGDVLVVQRKEIGRLVLGDIVLFKRDDRLFAHRVVGQMDRNGVPCVVTSGDSLPANDPPVFPHELLGSVTSIVRGTRQISPQATLFQQLISSLLRNSDFLSRCFLWLLCRNRAATQTIECPT